MMRKKAKIIIAISAISAIVLSSFLVYTFSFATHQAKVYVISGTNQDQNSLGQFQLVNRLLLNGFNVYQVEDQTKGGSTVLEAGDLVIPQQVNAISSTDKDLLDTYLTQLAKELNVTIEKINLNFDVDAFELKAPKIAIYYGNGASGGSLEHYQPLEKAGFQLTILNATEVETVDLSQFNVISFPGGGPYQDALTPEALSKIKAFVAGGGGYVGTCGGSAFGVTMELLEVHMMDGLLYPQYSEYADLRGSLVLSLADVGALTSGYDDFMDCVYFKGPFFDAVGSDVTVVARLNSTTPQMETFYPELFSAYNFSINVDSINRAWGTPAVVAGEYGQGKVVLSTVHPEILEESQRLFFNFYYYALSGQKVTLNGTENVPLNLQSSPVNGNGAGLNGLDENNYSQAMDFLADLRESSASAEEIIVGYLEVNYQVEGLSGDYLNKYITDVNSRSTQLLQDLNALKTEYSALENLKDNTNGNMSLEASALQEQIIELINRVSVEGNFSQVMAAVSAELVAEGNSLTTITNSENGTQRYQMIIDLYSAETGTMGTLKDRVDSLLLPWASSAQTLLVRGQFLILAGQP
jgi:glutamine amidotransferase-like uncharacterized protein